jgi:sister-chromatid-cohesion protein PDS5
MPDPTKANEDLMAFAKQNVGQMYRELKVLLDPQTELKTFIKNEVRPVHPFFLPLSSFLAERALIDLDCAVQRDFLRRLEKFPSPTSALQTFTSFIRLSTHPYISRSSIPQLLKRLQGGSINTYLTSPSHASEADQFAASAARVLEFVSRNKAVLFKAHVAELGKALSSEGAEERVTEEVLRALAGLKKVDEGVVVDGCVSLPALVLSAFSRRCRRRGTDEKSCAERAENSRNEPYTSRRRGRRNRRSTLRH